MGSIPLIPFSSFCEIMQTKQHAKQTDMGKNTRMAVGRAHTFAKAQTSNFWSLMNASHLNTPVYFLIHWKMSKCQFLLIQICTKSLCGLFWTETQQTNKQTKALKFPLNKSSLIQYQINHPPINPTTNSERENKTSLAEVITVNTIMSRALRVLQFHPVFQAQYLHLVQAFCSMHPFFLRSVIKGFHEIRPVVFVKSCWQTYQVTKVKNLKISSACSMIFIKCFVHIIRTHCIVFLFIPVFQLFLCGHFISSICCRQQTETLSIVGQNGANIQEKKKKN